MLEKTENMVLLLDFYGPLLTNNQQHILNLYYELDYSLTEIAHSLDITRQAVYDVVKRAEKLLLSYENKLGLVDRFKMTHNKLAEAQLLLSNDEKINPDIITKVKDILHEVTDTLL
ncbi:MAG: DNA-binding protein [Syntrophomonadaceae bacterium]|nr:DNA-binding protein [Syntrophomonadaceae bacterium]